jgi:hypothetical protein
VSLPYTPQGDWPYPAPGPTKRKAQTMTYEWTPERSRELVDRVVGGATVPAAAAAIGTTDRTAYRQAKRDAAFGAALTAAVAEREARRARVGCGTRTRYNAGCRCPLCRDACRRNVARLRALRRGQPIPEHVPHGSPSTYTYYSCRCAPCSAAWSASCADYCRRRRAASPSS